MISILLASYNGEKYIAGQIDSLLNQTIQDFRLFICDDASTDDTYSMLSDYSNKNPGKIHVSRNRKNSGGAKHNFIEMMINHKDDYVMLCDQDDVWLPTKIEVTLAKMREMESEFGSETPLLVHSDLVVVSKKLETIFPSFKIAMNADYSKTELQNQIIQNTLTGCKVMYNKSLADLITEVPEYMVMHDWWLIIIASAFVVIGTINEPTILYRQHEDNDIGAKNVRSLNHILYELHHWKLLA